MINTKIGIYRRGIKINCKEYIPLPLPAQDVNIFCQHTFSDEKREISMYKKPKNTFRGKVTVLSKKSKSRLSWVYNQYDWKSMLTFTYHKKFPECGTISKKHLDYVLKKITRMNIKYLWVLEWQSRGFPHYHIWLSRELTDIERIDLGSFWIKTTKEYNDTRESELLHLSESIYTKWSMMIGVNYAVKYAYKSEQKGLPDNFSTYGRWFGTSRMSILPDIEYVYNSDDQESYNEMIRFQRNVHRCIYKWSKKEKIKKRKKVDTIRGFYRILSETRQEAIKKLFEYHFEALTQIKPPEWLKTL